MKYQKARNKKAEPKHIPECGECVRSEGYKIVSSQQAEIGVAVDAQIFTFVMKSKKEPTFLVI